MSEHTPTPWVEVGSHDFRGADMSLVGMVNPTVKQGKIDRAFIVKACNSHYALVKALAIFLGGDGRFQVAVGGNPNAVEKMLAAARETLEKAS